MAPISLKIVMDDGVVTRMVKFDTNTKVSEAHAIVDEKMMTAGSGKEYRLFLTSTDNERSGIWLEDDKTLDFYILRDGDSLHFLCKTQSLRVKMLDGSVKTLLVDKAMPVGELMQVICHKIGLANHDEYGLCYEETTKPEEMNPAMGTLTMKKKPQQREKDAKLEHLSKKLKTDDNVQWLDQHKSLRELNVDPSDTLLLKRRLFYSDRKVDARDPVQLNLLYVQARDAILDGRHPVTSDKAVEFAGLQCQVQFGDYQEEKHKPGFIEKLKEFLPEQYAGSRSIEKKIIKEFQKHQGLGEVDAKNLYTKTARDLPTYGVTFFLVKEKPKGVKKLVPRLLGISCESVLRLDEVTKEILQTWPLTQVKTFQVGKTETFTLNFGDYSDKEYTVKTNEGFRIRDILQGYIDLIGRRMHAGPFNTAAPTGGQLMQERVEAGRANLMEHVTQTPIAVVEQSYVGPSKIISYEPGQTAVQGTQIVTVQQLVIADKAGAKQRAVTGGVPMRNDMSKSFVKKLNSLNSNSVKIVTFLTDPTKENIEQTKKTVTAMEEVMPDIIKGVKETAEKQSSEDARNLLLSQLQELDEFLASLCYQAKADPFNTFEVEETAKKTADLSTQIYFALDARTRRRGNFVERSRQSFIEDEATRASLHRASFIATSATTCHGINNCLDGIEKEYAGPTLDYSKVNDLEKETVDRMGKLNAAIALLLDAHADPKHIDYTSALNSLNTINELLPELTNNIKVLSSIKDEKSRIALLGELRELCEAARNVCMSTGSDDLSKLQESANSYADVSGKLIYKFGRGVDPDKENEIIDLAREVGNKTSIMLVAANELATMTDFGPAANDVDAAGVRCADAARALLAAAQLTAPSIREPRCQSALTAAAENLSSSAQHLASTWKSLVEQPGQQKLGEELRSHSLQLARALDRLKDAYANLNDTMVVDDEEGPASKDAQRLKFITTISGAKKHIQDAKRQLLEPVPSNPITEDELLTAQKKYTKNLGNLNASIAALLAAMANRENPDYVSADSAINTIVQLMPKIVEDNRALSRANDVAGRQKELQDLFGVVSKLCAFIESGHSEKLPEVVSEYAILSNQLIYTRGMGTSPQKEQEIIFLTNKVRDKTSALLEEAKKLTIAAKGDPAAADVEKARGNCIDATNILLTTAQLTTPSIEERRCLTALTAATENLASSAQHLTFTCKPLVEQPAHQQTGQHLQACSKDLASTLDNLRHAFNNLDNGEVTKEEEVRRDRERQRLFFKSQTSAAENSLQSMEKELNEPFMEQMEQQNLAAIHQKLSDSMASLNAAIAGLIAAKSRQDFVAAKLALDKVNKIMPEVVKDAKILGSTKNEKDKKEFLDNMRVLCETVRHLTTTSDDPKDIQATANAFTETSEKLLFTFGRGVEPYTENEVVQQAQVVRDRTAELLGTVKDLTTTMPSDILNDSITAAGVNCANDTQVLLATAKVTAPLINDPQCQKAITTATQTLSISVQHLASICRLPVQHPNRFHIGERLQTNCINVAEALDKLKKSYSNLSYKQGPKISADNEKLRLRFITTLAGAEDKILAAQKQLDEPVKCKPMQDDTIKASEHQLSNGLNHLNAAIATLVATTADKENPDYIAAESAINTIIEQMPKTIEDSRALSSTVDKKSKESLLEDTKSFCDAARRLCACINSDDPEKIQDAANTYANASRKLIYRVKREVQDKENKVIDLAQEVGQKTSQLLLAANELVVAAESEPTVNEVDVAGVSCADAARALLSTAQVTSPSIYEPLCQQALTSSANMLSSKVKKLSDACKPLTEHPARQHLCENLKRHDEELSKAIERLKNLYKNLEKKQGPKLSADQEIQRLKFVTTLTGAQDKILAAQKQLEKPIKSNPMKDDKIKATQHKFSNGLNHLNAAIALLVATTADKENLDYIAAESVINTIIKLMPNTIEDSRALSSTIDENSKISLLEDTKLLCDAARKLCLCVHSEDPEKIQDAANTYANASRKLIYRVERGVQDKENEVVDLAQEVGQKTSQLLEAANELVVAAASEPTVNEVDIAGVSCADTARALLSAAQVTSPSIHEPLCQQALTTSANMLSSKLNKLSDAWKPLTEHPARKHLGANLKRHDEELSKSIERLKNVFRILESPRDVVLGKTRKPKTEDRHHIKFISSITAAEYSIKEAENHLNQPVVSSPMKQEKINVLQNNFGQNLGLLNASTAALIAATTNWGKQDYITAKLAANNITQLMPNIVEDSMLLSSTVDEVSKQALLDEMRALCDLMRTICATSPKDPEKLQVAAKKYADVSGKLVYMVGRGIIPEKGNEIIGLAQEVAAKTTGLLIATNELTSAIPNSAATELDATGADVADAARSLLAAAQVTASTIHEQQCKNALNTAVQNLSTSTQHFAATWKPLVQQPSCYKLGENLQLRSLELAKALDCLKNTYSDIGEEYYVQAKDGGFKGQKRTNFVRMTSAENQIRTAEKLLDEPLTKPLLNDQEIVALHVKYSKDMSDLNAAIAALVAATADQGKPDHSSAELAVNTIRKLMQEFVKETKALSSTLDDKCREKVLQETRELCNAVGDLCALTASEDYEKIPEVSKSYYNASGKLVFRLGRRKSGKSNEVSPHSERLAAIKAAIAEHPWRHQSDKLACAGTKSKQEEKQHAELVNNLESAENAVRAVEKLLNVPLTVPPGESQDAATLQRDVSQNMGRLNAALADLMAAFSNCDKPNYEAAETALKTISETLPVVAKDTRMLTDGHDEKTQSAALNQLKNMSEAIREVCAGARRQQTEDMGEFVAEFSAASGKLFFIVSPTVDQAMENQVMMTTVSSCEKVSQLLSHVHQLAKAVGESDGIKLDKSGSKLADAAQTLIITSQITAPCISEQQCQSALLSSVDALSSTLHDLSTTWKPLTVSKHKPIGEALEHERQDLEEELLKLRNACQDELYLRQNIGNISKRAPPVPIRRVSLLKSDKTVARDQTQKTQENSEDFLEHLRQEEINRQMAEDQILQTQFAKCIDNANKLIVSTENSFRKVLESKVPVTTNIPLQDLQKKMELEIAKSAVAAASFVAANQPDKLEYNAETATANDFSKSVAQILEYAKPLSSCLDESSRKLIIEDTLNLSQAARKVCETAMTDRKKLSEAAVTFGEKYAKLLYAVSEDVNPNQEKEVLARAREIGESASRVALEGAELASSAPGELGRELCSAGRSCADAAVTLFYTTKILSPTIQVPENQTALAAASKYLSTRVDAYTAACKPLGADPKHASSFKKLNLEADQLRKLLDNFRQDLGAGKLLKRREGRLVIEDTPLKQLATKILEIAKKKAEKSAASAGENYESAYAEYAKKLADAIRLVDLANAKCKASPHDASTRLELEDVIQNLQQTLLLARPHHGAKERNIVDLADFVKDVSTKAEQLIDSANKTRSSGPKKPLESIINECHKINLNEFKLLKPQGDNKDTSALENILDVKYFGQDCDSRLSKINSNINNFDDDDLKRVVQDKANTLDESCDYLRFATKSALATALSAAFDEALYDLTDFDKKMDKMLIPRDGDKPFDNKRSSSLLMSKAKLLTAVSEAARPSGVPRIASAFTLYVTEMRARTDLCKPADKDRLTEHLRKLLHLLKTITVSTSRRVATWQPVDEAEVAAIAEEIIQELETPLYKHDANSGPQKTQILASKDISRLLMPFDQVKVEGDKAKLEEKLQHVATKLNTVAGTVVQSVHSPQSLTRSAHAAVDAALELGAVARALDNTEPLQNKKIEEAVQEMSFATFGLLKTAECASQDPNNKGNRRRLLDACRLLNNSINKLGRAPASSNKLRRECDESIRSLQYGLQLGALKDTSSAVAASSYTDCLEALAKQRDVLQELTNDKQMSKEEFSKSLSTVTSVINSSTEYAAQCAYLLSLSEKDKDLAEVGIVDVAQIKKTTTAIQDTCSTVLVHLDIDKAKEDGQKLTSLVEDLQQALQKTSEKIKNRVLSTQLSDSVNKVDSAVKALNQVITQNNTTEDKITPATIGVLDAINAVNTVTEHLSITPEVGKVSAETQARIDEVTNNAKNLTSKVITIIKEVKTVDDDDEAMTWVMFNSNRTGVLGAFEELMNSIRANGQKAGLIQADVFEEDSDSAKKSYLEIQLDLANKWLKRPTTKPNVKSAGEKAARSILELGETILEELKGSDKDEMHHLTNEIKQLLDLCIQKYDSQKASVLMERLKETKKAIERSVVTRVVEDFIEEEYPLQDLEIFVDAERDETKRKFLLEKKIAELLAHLGKVTKTARIVSDTRKGDQELRKCSNQAELLAPILVKAAEERVNSPNNQVAKEKYKSVLAQYAESLSKVREMCDRAVDPMDFVQTAGETMQRMREESSEHNDPQKNAYTSAAITKLANRVIHVGMSSDTAKRDPELQRALAAARERLSAAIPAADTRASRMPDFNTTTAEILRTAGEVESALGGENIFNKQPEPNQPIYNAALNLHATLREWSARDNDIVAVAKRMAVQMAKLSDFMYADKKREVLLTSKEIVEGAHEVAELAKKLALECTDLRIRKDLLQVCETIPTISGQLKMLTTIKGSSLGHQGTEEDKEAMNMLIGNAQNLMICIQDVIKSAAAASVKIRSQRGGTRIRWVRKNYLL